VAAIAAMVIPPVPALLPATMVPVFAARAAIVGLLDRRTLHRLCLIRRVHRSRRDGRCADCSEAQNSCGGREGYHGLAHGMVLLPSSPRTMGGRSDRRAARSRRKLGIT